MKRQFSLFLVAVQFLTRLPMPPLREFEPNWLSRSVRYFPLVGALIGLIGAGVWWLSSRCFPPSVAVGLSMSASLLLTGALHEDGFADVCDGFGGGASRESILAIMKDSRVGAYGAIGIAMMLGLKWATLASLPRASLPILFIGAHMTSRWCATGLIWRLQYARTDADAKSRPFAGGLSTADWVLSGALGVLVLLAFLALLSFLTLQAPPPPLLPLRAIVDPAAGADLPWARILVPAAAAAAAIAFLAGTYFKKRIGGYTGDCLGAAQQLAELSFLLAALALMSISMRPAQ
jgi:adenosylcobinamide-GDP ribazoletransferase